MMASASPMTYTPSVTSAGGNSNNSSAADTEPISASSQQHQTNCEDKQLALSLDIATNGTASRGTTTKRSYIDGNTCFTFPSVGFGGDSESPKKRRKQSTPVKIPTCASNQTEADQMNPTLAENNNPAAVAETSSEGKLETHNSSSSPANSTPSPGIFNAVSTKAAGDEDIVASESNPRPTSGNSLSQNIHSDLFKIDFGAPNWISTDMQNTKLSEDWLNTSTPLHNIPFTFPALQSPSLSSQVSPFPMIDSSQQSGHILARPMNQPRIRIFNPDAYCELCNKEFCNKYFLKTHKANKHGIYTDLPPNEFNFPPTTVVTPIPTSTPIAATKSALNPSSTSSVPDHQQLPNVSTSPHKTTDSLPKIASTLLMISCDICQKKFCNKNFVRRHKAKVHGINDSETGSCDPDNENSNLDPNVVSDSNSERNTPQQVNTSPNYCQEGLLSECLKPFLDSTEIDQENVAYRWPITAGIQPSGGLNSQIREAIHRPRGLGIINPEAFCEICCKEYCNKYFLRTHKLKRHGIAIPDDPPAKDSTDGLTVQTSPLNLIKSEQTNSSESYAEKKNPSPISDIIMCGICSVHVSQKYMKAHYEACHIAKPIGDPPTISTATSSPASTSGRQLDNEDLNITEAASNDKPTEENVNHDLKKLQTMILELNSAKVCQIVTCNVCCKEFENKYYLQAHMMSDHGQLYMKITDEKISIQNTTSTLQHISTNSNESSKSMLTEQNIKPTISEVEFQQRLTPQQAQIMPENLLKTDNTTMRPNVSTPVNTSASIPTSITSSERRTSISLAPTNSYCEICNKELCNKYFMKTHMQRMHGIEIENGAQIGGVVCNICNKELCSKYFLRVHKHNTHGIVEDGMPLPQSSRQTNEDSSQPLGVNVATSIAAPTPSTSDTQAPPPPPTQQGPFPMPNDSSLKPNELGDLNHRYFAHFTEVCPICSRRFRSTKWLKAHLVTDHGKIEHDKWEELEMIYQKQSIKNMSDNQSKQLSHGMEPDLMKVSNGGNSGQDDGQENKIGLHSLLSNIFGQDELNSKKYYCSYCNFSTPVLAFLFVHERSHGQQPIFNKNENIYQCPICTQSYQSAELLQKHLIVQHASNNPIVSKQVAPSNTTAPNYKTIMSDMQQLGVGSTTGGDTNNSNHSLTATEKQPLDLGLEMNRIKEDTNGNETPKSLIRVRDFDLSRIFHSELIQNLTDMSQQIQLPTTYALPNNCLESDEQTDQQQQQSDTVDKKYMMQPFLIEEYLSKDQTTMGLQLRLVPCLVFLPVREKITSPVTTSIKLTPT